MTEQEYKQTLAEIDRMTEEGGLMHEWCGLVTQAYDYERKHGISPNAIERWMTACAEARRARKASK